MWIQILALLALAALLWWLFRLAMGLRWAKVSREGARSEEEARGRRVVAEVPTGDGTLGFFAEDHAGFYWPRGAASKRELRGARLLLNGGVISAAARTGAALPDPPALEPFEGRERWEVALYLEDGRTETVPCGTVREGVSREIAARVFAAVRQALETKHEESAPRPRAAGGS